MSAALERAARRLAALTPAERGWVLSRLAPEDALRMRELLDPPPPAVEPQAPREPASPLSMLEQATASEVAAALQGEPDWLVALVLARRRWPWDRELLATFDAPRVAALGRLARSARESAKPKACEAAIEVLAARLAEMKPRPAPASSFEELLERAQRNEA